MLCHRLLPVLATLTLAPAMAEDSRITQVTLYPGSATVERSLSVAAGASQAVFSCLPAQLDAASLQVSAGDGVRLGELSLRTLPRDQAAGCKAPSTQAQQLQQRLATLRAELAGIEQGQAYLGGFAQPGQGPRESAHQIANTLEALLRHGQQLTAKQQQLQTAQAQVERELAQLPAQEQPGTVTQVTVQLAATRAATVQLRYQQTGAGWQPGYRANLHLGSAEVELVRTAEVAQQTGEDWSQVRLRLSTGRPQAASSSPLPRPWRLDQAPEPNPMQALQEVRRSSLRAPAPPLPMPAAAEPAPLEPTVFDSGVATEFVLPQPATIQAGRERITLTLDSQRLPARITSRSTPALDAKAYLIASFTPPAGVWPAGAITLQRDGSYIGQARFDVQRAGQTGLSFGVDERLQVRALPQPKQEANRGLMGGQRERQVNQRWEISNRYTQPIALEVLDAAPVAEHADIRVQSQYSPEPVQTDWNDQAGLVRWELQLAPGSTQSIGASHTIRWPQDFRLQERR